MTEEEEAPKPESSLETSLSESQSSLVNIIGDTEVVVRPDENTKSDVNPLDEHIPAKTPDYKEAPAGGAGGVETSSDPAANSGQITSPHGGENGGTGGSLPDVTEAAAWPHVAPDEGQSPFLPRSLSVPVIPSVHSQGSSLPGGVGREPASTWQSKVRPGFTACCYSDVTHHVIRGVVSQPPCGYHGNGKCST